MLLNRGLGQPLAALVGHPGGPAARTASDPSADWPTPLSASLLGDQLEARRAELRATLPIRRVVGPADVGALAVHIMTNTALTGATYDVDRGGFVLPPSPASALPSDPRIAAHGLRTIPPREQAGNVDIKQLSKGAHLLIPVDVPRALFSAGDAHFAQGDCETCGTAIEMDATLHVRFSVRKGEAAQKGIRYPRFTRQDYYLPPEFAAPRRFYATTGISVTRDGVDHSETSRSRPPTPSST